MELDYTPAKLAPTCKRFALSDAPVRLIMGPLGSAKSSTCVRELARRAMRQKRNAEGLRRTRWAVIRNSYRELEDTTRKTFEDWIPLRLGRWREADFAFDLRFDDVQAEVLFRALDRPDDVRKLLSLELTGAYINEAREMPKGVFDMLGLRVGRYPAMRDGGPTWSGIWMDTNPPDTDHWIYKLFEEDKPAGFALFRQPGGRSPNAENLENLKPGYYEQGMLGKTAAWIKVYVDGEYAFVRDGRAVFPEYDDETHCREFAITPGAPIRLGMDFGLTPAAVLAQRGADGQLQVFDELVAEELGAVTFARELARRLRSEHPKSEIAGWGDPAGEQRSQVDERTPFDVVHAAGLPISRARTNDFTLRREAVAGLLTRLTSKARPALVIHPRCRWLRKALAGGYCFKRVQVSGEERYRDEPLKDSYSHVADALQYLCIGEGEDRSALSGGQQRRVSLPFRSRSALGR
jgi:hypothetical protein